MNTTSYNYNSNLSFDEKIKIALQFNNLSQQTKNVLTRVYATFAVGLLFAVAGVMFSMFIYRPWDILFLGIIYPAYKFHTERNMETKYKYFLLLASLIGMATGPLINFYYQENPAIILSAFMMTTGVFTCFSLFSLLSDKRMFIYMGGSLFSFSLFILFGSIFNIFARNEAVYNMLMAGILLMECGYLIFDTQLIVFRIEKGDYDFFKHALVLLLDFVDLFRVILKILGSKKKKNSSK
ncbi:hypothetical protein DLAC_05669 [Tieghemostelium lacteum]|uniref:Bax inhibitor 1 n=1 Tax=Tieghemostelium lacteum TaxID=361077 RepID=A0A151ZGF4_TIELA|nr:hypothetical protein DLAC_05669 [Tieghemostelium lacteum]|eukprot:KYQ93058.1 hypothetical protein DLAC_05669 [Tieghemostelium lacteum]